MEVGMFMEGVFYVDLEIVPEKCILNTLGLYLGYTFNTILKSFDEILKRLYNKSPVVKHVIIISDLFS